MNISHSGFAVGAHIINLSGPLNANLAEEVTQTFRDISDQGIERVVINLADVPFIDSRGLVALVAGYRIFGSNARNFRLAALDNQPKLLFDLTGFDRIFQTFDSVAEATKAELDSQAYLRLSFPVFVPQPATLDSMLY